MNRVFQRLVRRCLLAVSLAALIATMMGSGIVTSASAQAPSHLSPTELTNLSRYGETQCLQPPTHMNLATLSDAQLVQYGFPTHDVMRPNLEQWTTALAHAQHRTCGSKPANSAHTPAVKENETRSIWSGYATTDGPRGTYKAAMLTTNVPTLQPTVSGAHASIWAGVGGVANGKLVQDGIDSTLDQNGNQINVSWWEVLPAAEQDLPLSRGLSAGDRIWIYMNSNPNNNGSDEFYIQNQSTNDYNSHYEYGGANFSDSAVAECIVERPSIGGPTPLANFGTIYVSQCQVYLDGHQYMDPIGNYPNIALDIANGNTILDHTSGLDSGQNFHVDWWSAL